MSFYCNWHLLFLIKNYFSYCFLLEGNAFYSPLASFNFLLCLSLSEILLWRVQEWFVCLSLFYLGFIFLCEFMSWFLFSGLEIWFCITFSNIASVILSLSCLSKAVEHTLDLFTFLLYFLCPFTNSPTFLIFMFESGYLLLSCLQVYKTTLLLCLVQTHLLVFNFHYCILWFYNFHFTLFSDIRFPVKYFILSFIFLNMYSCFTVCVR